MKAPLRRISALLFCSGLCALVYQVAWLKELRLVFGGSTAASAAVLAVFMGGLGAGGLYLGKRAAKHLSPLALYGKLELSVALTAAATPLVLALARKAYVALGGTPALGLGFGTAARLAISALVLGVPVFLMGGTLPAAAQAAETESDSGRRHLAFLYGANTLGAVTGVLLSTFFLLERLGTRLTLWSACALNIVIALTAIALAKRIAAAPAAPEAKAAEASKPALDAVAPLHPAFALWAAAVTGFAFLLMELVWYRMLGPILGGSTFTFGLILLVALLGIGLGGFLYAMVGRKLPATLEFFSLTCALEAACLALPFAAGDRIAVLAASLRADAGPSFLHQVLGWAVVCAFVVLPASFCSGVQFPLLVALIGRGREDVAKHTGLAYAWNTAGAILGSLAGGFGLLPLLTAPGAWRAAAGALALLGLSAIVFARKASLPARLIPLTVTALAVFFLAARGPGAPWRHGGVGVGRGPETTSSSDVQDWLNRHRRSLVWEADGVESSVGVIGYAGLAFVVNGKVDGNARDDATMQVMSGLIGALQHPRDVQSSLVIGLGTGSTAGWLGAIPTMQRVDVVEMEPAVLRMARECAAVNRDVMNNPKVHTFIGDAREVLLTTSSKYDLIFSEPSNPYRAGIASLFTKEFYESSVKRLSDDGLLVQWLQVYDIDDETVRTVYNTLAQVFPYIETWMANGSDLVLVAGKKKAELDVAKLQARLKSEPFKSALVDAWRVDDLEGILAHHVGSDRTAKRMAELAEGRLNTDDQTRIEYGFARAVTAQSTFDASSVRQIAAEFKEDKPALAGVRWELIPERLSSMNAVDGEATGETPDGASDQATRWTSVVDHWINGDLDDALAELKEHPLQASDPIQAEALAEVLADDGQDAALPVIERVRAFSPPEADVFLGRLKLRQNKLAEATAALSSAFIKAQTDPWPLPLVLSRGLALAVEVAQQDNEDGEKLYSLIEKPFAVQVSDEDRLFTRVKLAQEIDFSRLCHEAFAPLEPAVPWDSDMLAARVQCYGEEPGKLREAKLDQSAFYAP